MPSSSEAVQLMVKALEVILLITIFEGVDGGTSVAIVVVTVAV
jgi:hypothetical protein